LPRGASFVHVAGLALIAGIGFTVSLFITGLAFESPEVVDDAKLGILAASAIAATLGTIVLSRAKPVVEIETETPEDEAAEAP